MFALNFICYLLIYVCHIITKKTNTFLFIIKNGKKIYQTKLMGNFNFVFFLLLFMRNQRINEYPDGGPILTFGVLTVQDML